ncbi:MAG: hypothetical protein ABIL09_25710 [Gemmatimonadota bacterium]
MEQMVEPDRTIMVVSIIGLVVIWGSVAYHKFVQGGGPPRLADELPGQVSAAEAPSDASAAPIAGVTQGRGKKRRGKR